MTTFPAYPNAVPGAAAPRAVVFAARDGGADGGDGPRFVAARDALAGAEFFRERYGGFASANVRLHAERAAAYLPPEGLPPFARIEAWRAGRCVHRSYLAQPTFTDGDPAQVQASGVGFVQAFVADTPVDRILQYKQPVDLAQAFRDLVRIAVTPQYPDVVVDARAVGVKRERLDFTGRTFRECLDALVDEAGNAAVWGSYVAEDVEGRPDRLYFGPFDAATGAPAHAYVVPSTGVAGAGGERDYTKLKTCLRIDGGRPNNPNLLPNSGFGRPVRAGGQIANLFLNPSMAENGNDWGGGGSWKAPNSANESVSEGADGGGWWEIDLDGEAWQQIRVGGVAVEAGEPHELAFRWRSEQADFPARYKTTFYWSDGGLELDGTRLEDPWWATVDGQPGSLGETDWTRKGYAVPLPPPGADGFYFRVDKLEGGNAFQQGTYFDAAELIQTTAIRQEGWELSPSGAGARVVSQDWLYPDDAGDGSGVCLRADVEAENNDENDVHLQLANRARYTVEGGVQLRQIVHLKKDPQGKSSPAVRLEMVGFREDGKENGGPSRFTIPAGALDSNAAAVAAGGVAVGNGWYKFTHVRDTGVLERGGTADVQFRGDGAVLVDMLAVRNADETGWVRSGDFRAEYKAHVLFAAAAGDPDDPDHPVYRSGLPPAQGGFGERWHTLSLPSIGNDADAEGYARRWLRQWAVVGEPPRVTHADPAPGVEFWPGERYRVGGEFSRQLAEPVQPVVQVREAWEGDGRTLLEVALGREPRDEAEDFLEMVERRLDRENAALAGASGSSGAAGSGGGAGGGYVTAGASLATAARAGVVRTDVTVADPEGAVVVTAPTYDAGQAAQDAGIAAALADAAAALGAVTDTPERLARYGLGGVLLATSIASDGDNIGLDDGELWTRHVRFGEHLTSLEGTAFRGAAVRPRGGDFPMVFRAVPSGSATRSQLEVYSRSLFDNISDGDYRAIFQADGATVNLGSDFAESTLTRLNLILRGVNQAWVETSGYLSVRRGLALTPYANVAPAEGQIWYEDGVGVQARVGGATVTLAAVGATPGTVTSVGLSLPSILFDVAGSPVTTSGTLTATLKLQAGSMFFASPPAGGGPTFRNILPIDVPSLDANKITTGTFAPGFLGSGPTGTGDRWLRNDGQWSTLPLDVIGVRVGGALIGTRPTINFTVNPAASDVTATDDALNNRVDVVLPGGGGGGGGGFEPVSNGNGAAPDAVFIETGDYLFVSNHEALTGADIHRVINWTFASAAAMNAAVVTAADLYKWCWRTDINRAFVLISAAPGWTII